MGTSFEDMSHEQMLAWLDQANAGTVAGAASRLKYAADEITKIAEELRIGPQWVEWKGDGADTFRAWASDLTSATRHLADFSTGASDWLSQASDAIALAQSSIPRDMPGAQANLDAATKYHNDPDSAAIRTKSAQNLAALTADKEKVRQEAAAQMTKLAQSYSWSATQINGLERPQFPPPPKAFVPTDAAAVENTRDLTRSGGSTNVSSAVGTASTSAAGQSDSGGVTSVRNVSDISTVQPRTSGETLPVRTSIDSVATLPTQTPVETPRTPVDPGPVRGAVPPGPVSPLFGGGQALPVNNSSFQGRGLGAGRAPMPLAGQEPGTATPFSRVPGVSGGGGNGIIGGRPVLPAEGRPTGAIPRGMVVGGEGTPARGPMGMGQTPGMASSAGRAAGAPGMTPGGRPVTPAGGIVGGNPTSNARVVGGGSVQQPGRAGGRAPGSGAVGSGAAGPRNGITGGTTATGRSSEGHVAGGTASRPPQGTQARSGSGRPYGVTEDEETWRRNHRPTVPPVVD
ncbi:hypothetical protein a10_05378 [Streptomyces acidiscabies]|nr:hypothetical protein a10_05378 [Streptomyces acidiscabies]